MPDERRHKDLNSAAMQRARVHPKMTGLTGAGVVICVIDYGFDLLHPALRTSLGETRFAALIDQSGHCLTRSKINNLIRTCERNNSRRVLDEIYDPHANYFGREGVQVGAHGTWVASIAAGSRTADFCGVAPNATLIGVQLDLPDNAWREEDADGRPTWIDAAVQGPEALRRWNGWHSYDESAAVIEALEESYELARVLKPEGIVINLSIGAWAGGHESGSPVNRAIDAITANGKRSGEPATIVVTGTGNAGADGGHISGDLTGDTPVEFYWSLDTESARPSKLELWSDCTGDIGIHIRSSRASGDVDFTLDGTARGTMAIATEDGQLIGVVENRGAVRDGLRAVRIVLHPALMSPAMTVSDRWEFEVSVGKERTDDSGIVHAWIERDCSGSPLAKLHPKQCGFKREEAPPRDECSLTSIACAASVVAVAGLDTEAAGDAVLALSGRGPRPWRRPWSTSEKLPSPLLAAPANRLFGARSKTTGYMRGSGTSGAAALASGAVAIALEAADLTGRKLDHNLLTSALLGGTNALERPDTWQPDRGFGAMCFNSSALFNSTTSNTQNSTDDPSPTVVPRKETTSDERTLPPPV